MNKARRKAIGKIKEELESLKDGIQDILDDEEEYRDNMPENLQSSERYDEADSACDNLADVLISLEEAICSIEEI